MINKNFEALLEAEEQNPELEEKTVEIEKRLRDCVREYITLAAEFGITLTESDFNSIGRDLAGETDPESDDGIMINADLIAAAQILSQSKIK